MLQTLTFGPWLKEQRQARDLTQADLARQVGCSASLIFKLEAGERRPSRQVAALLAAFLDVPEAERAAFAGWARGRPGEAAYQPTVLPPAAPVGAASPRLPIPPTAFIGRAAEVAAVRGALWRASTRLVTLTGPPGIGKTRLALAVVAALRADFTDGVVFVNLAPLTDPLLVAPTIAAALGVRAAPRQSLLMAVQEYLGEKQLLLLLDNFEQVVATAPLVSELLAAAPRLKVLATSRAALRLRGERVHEVPPLALADPAHLPPLAALREVAAVALFLERAQDAAADFQLTSANAAAVAAICLRLEGVPLAIELAAAQSKLLPPAALLARLDQHQALLDEGFRDLPPHQQTLRDALAWSYDLLDPVARQLFRRLGGFVGGWTLEAAEAVAGGEGSDTLRGLRALVDQSLVRQETAGETVRFTMLALIREYAREQLAAHDEHELVSRRHAHYYLALAEAAAPELTRAEQARWVDRLDAEIGNLRAVLAWAGAQGAGEPEALRVGLQLGAALRRFWLARGYLAEAREHLDRLLALAAAHRPTVPLLRARAAALVAAGATAVYQSDYLAAEGLAAAGLDLYRALGDPLDVADTLVLLAHALTYRDAYAPAEAAFQEALALLRPLGDRWRLARTFLNMGILAARQGDAALARAYYEESLPVWRDLDDKFHLGTTLTYLGFAAMERGDYPVARALLEEADGLWRALGHRWGIADSLINQGRAALRGADFAAASAFYREGLPLAQALGDLSTIAYALEGLAQLAAHQHRPERAARLWGAAGALWTRTERSFSPAEQGDHDRAVAQAQAPLAPAAWDRAWAAGAAWPLARAVAYALEAAPS